MNNRPLYGEPSRPNPGSQAPDYGGSLFPDPKHFVWLVVIMFVVFMPLWGK